MKPPFALLMAWRESRRGRRRLALYIAAVSLGVAALVAINSFSANVTASIRAQARTLLGADVELSSRAPFPDSVEAVLDSVAHSGAPVARVTSFASMVLAPRTGRTRLVQIRAVAGRFPFYGNIETDPPGLWATFQSQRAVLVDPAILIQLDVRVGDTLALGTAQFVVSGVVLGAPGDVGLRTAIGPRVFLPARYVEETELLQFGSRARYRAYVALPDPKVQRLLNHYNALFDRHRVHAETVAEQEADLTEALGRLTRYLGLIGLVALLLGGLGVASAVTVFAREKLDAAAVLRCLGARQRTVLATYLAQAAALGLLGAGAGVALGVVAQLALPLVLRDFLPVDVSVSVSPATAFAGLGIGVGTAILFALLPLLRLRDVPPLQALRREFDTMPSTPAVIRSTIGGVLVAALVAISVWQAPTRVTGIVFAVAVVAAAALLWATARALMWATRRWFPTAAPYVVRQGVANLFRPHNQTAGVILALGFGVFLIATLLVVQRNLLAQFAFDTNPNRPNLVLFDVQVDQRADLTNLLQTRGYAPREVTPIVPARIARINGRAVDAAGADSAGSLPARWALQREYRNTYRDTLVNSEQLVAGTWWNATGASGMPRISVEEDLAAELGVGLGDRITWDVQGVPVETRIASLRRVTWARFQPNFFVVFEPGVLDAAPQTFALLLRVSNATHRAELQRDIVLAYPNVSTLDLTLVQRTLDGVLSRVALAVRFMALFSIGSGLAILVGALVASRFQRVREAVLLKTLGAGARQIRGILLTEYLAWGSFAAFTGVLLASAAGWALVTRLFGIPFHLPVAGLATIWGVVCGLTVVVGFANSAEVLRGTPLAVLRAMSE